MKYHINIEIQGLPKTYNSLNRKHWTIKAKEARQWRDNVIMAVGQNKPKEPLKKASIMFTRHSSGRPDSDGLVSSFKHICDGLIDAGILEDDNYDVIGMSIFKWLRVGPKEGKITIEVTEE